MLSREIVVKHEDNKLIIQAPLISLNKKLPLLFGNLMYRLIIFLLGAATAVLVLVTILNLVLLIYPSIEETPQAITAIQFISLGSGILVALYFATGQKEFIFNTKEQTITATSGSIFKTKTDVFDFGKVKELLIKEITFKSAKKPVHELYLVLKDDTKIYMFSSAAEKTEEYVEEIKAFMPPQ
jgi:hypothetical protein